MNAPKFTPGPWLYQQGFLWRGSGKLMPTGPLKIAGHGYIPDFVDNDEEAQANSRLIAAAPELYEALQDAWSALQYIKQHYHDERTASGELYGIGWDRVATAVRSALAKARGETS